MHQVPVHSALCLPDKARHPRCTPHRFPKCRLSYSGLSSEHVPGAGTLREAAWYSAKLSLISAILFTFATIAIVAGAYSSSHFQERNIHMACFLTVSGIAFM